MKHPRPWSSRLARLNALTAEVASRYGGVHVDDTGHAIAAAGTVRRLAATLLPPVQHRDKRDHE